MGQLSRDNGLQRDHSGISGTPKLIESSYIQELILQLLHSECIIIILRKISAAYNHLLIMSEIFMEITYL